MENLPSRSRNRSSSGAKQQDFIVKQEDTLLEFSTIPLGQAESDSISPVVASGFQGKEIHSMGTVMEGPREDCLELIKDCIREALEDVPRLSASIRLDIRPGHTGRIQANVRSVEDKLAS